MESVDRFNLAGLALICLKKETKVGAKPDLRDLISAAGAHVAEKSRREQLLRHLESADKAHPLQFGKSTASSDLERLLRRWTSNNDIPIADLNRAAWSANLSAQFKLALRSARWPYEKMETIETMTLVLLGLRVISGRGEVVASTSPTPAYKSDESRRKEHIPA